MLQQARSTQRHQLPVSDETARLAGRVTELASAYGRYGYRRVTALLHAKGWRVNRKRVERIWRQEGPKVPKRSRLWFNDDSWVRRRAEYRDHVWSYDFVVDRRHDGRPLRMLTVVDEWTRECLAIDVARGLRSEQVLDRLADLFVCRGTPAHLRSDHGKLRDALLNREIFHTLREAQVLIEG